MNDAKVTFFSVWLFRWKTHTRWRRLRESTCTLTGVSAFQMNWPFDFYILLLWVNIYTHWLTTPKTLYRSLQIAFLHFKNKLLSSTELIIKISIGWVDFNWYSPLTLFHTSVQTTSSFPRFFFRKFSRISEYKYCAQIWNQHAKCIKMSTNMPMFGPVVLEIACGIVYKQRHLPSIESCSQR